MLAVLLALLILNIFSLGMTFFSSQNHDLSTLAGGIIIKDKNEFETKPEDDLINTSSDTIEVSDSGE